MQERRSIAGLVGPIEIAVDRPAGAPRGAAFIGHPHPLYGGTLDNKVVATLARTFAAAGWLAVRPNFRGVGASGGAYDHGAGETDDFMHVIETAPDWSGGAIDRATPLALAGFSFGSFVAARACERLTARGRAPHTVVLVGPAAGKWPLPNVPPHTLVIHGELDETIPLTDVFDWARPQELPVVVLPGADHFFHRRLPALKRLVSGHLRVAFDAAGESD